LGTFLCGEPQHASEPGGAAHLFDPFPGPANRGYGRFTRELIKALLAREEGFRYTLLFDRRPADLVASGARVLSAETEFSLNDSAVGKSWRSPSYFLKMVSLARKAKSDVFFFPTLYSYFPSDPLGVPIFCTIHIMVPTRSRLTSLLGGAPVRN